MKISDSRKRALFNAGLVFLSLAAFAYEFYTRPGTVQRPGFTPEIGGSSGGTAGGSGGTSGTSSCCGTSNTGCGLYIGSGGDISYPQPDLQPAGCSGAGQCSAVSNGSNTCTGTNSTVEDCNYSCQLTCNAGFHPNSCGANGTSCVADSATACGATCANCTSTEIANSTGSCVNGACVDTCNSGFHSCNGSCVALGVSSCGDSCTNCATLTPSNSAASSCSITTGTGSGGVCECACNPGYWPSAAQACSGLSCASQSFATTY